MNITSHNINAPVATVVNPQTDALRRENHQREVITQPAAASQSAAEKGVASDKERARTPGQQAENIDFASIQEQAELANTTISDQQKGEEQESRDNQTDQQASDEEPFLNSEQEKAEQRRERAEEFVEQQKITELQQRDREVRTHEQAHSAAGGVATGAPSFSFEVGPDGKKYAVDGEVSVDLSPVKGNPRATIAKMQKVYSAALAPANPSVQDTRVANSAAQLIAQAQSELLANELEDPSKERELNRVISERSEFTGGLEENDKSSSGDFDRLVNQTLEAQESIAPQRSVEIDNRALRIENHYATINGAFEKPATSQFELTA